MIPSRPKVYFNGKFYGGPINGVHRVADRLLRQIDALAEKGVAQGWDMKLLLPAGDTWAPSFRNIEAVPQRWGRTQVWEQILLPFISRRGLLVSLANLAPAWHGRKLTMVHDAQFRISPRSYSFKLRWGYRFLIGAAARSSRRVVTVSEYARDSLDTFGVARRGNVVVLPNAADHILEIQPDEPAFARLGVGSGRFCLLFASSAEYKNVQIVFDAFRTGLPGLDLVVVGPDAAALRRAGLDPYEQAIFTGAIDDGVLRALYENALCLLYPSRTEGFGLPPLEAMTCGCPVVSAPSGAMPEVCRDAILYAAPGDPESWRKEIARLQGSAVLRMAKTKSGLERASHYRWEASGRQLLQEIGSLIPTAA